MFKIILVIFASLLAFSCTHSKNPRDPASEDSMYSCDDHKALAESATDELLYNMVRGDIGLCKFKRISQIVERGKKKFNIGIYRNEVALLTAKIYETSYDQLPHSDEGKSFLKEFRVIVASCGCIR